MELEYSLNEADIFALTKYQLEYVPATRRRLRVRRFAYLVGSALVALGAWILQTDIFFVVIFLALGILLFLFYPVY